VSYRGTEERRRGSSGAFPSGFGPTLAACEPWTDPPSAGFAVPGSAVSIGGAVSPAPVAPVFLARETDASVAVVARRLRAPGWFGIVGARAELVVARAGGECSASSPATDDLRCVGVRPSAVEGLLDPIADALRAVGGGAASDARLPPTGRVGAREMAFATPGPGADGLLPVRS
jgi:hypothetical protein